jgi:hypothetical protein
MFSRKTRKDRIDHSRPDGGTVCPVCLRILLDQDGAGGYCGHILADFGNGDSGGPNGPDLPHWSTAKWALRKGLPLPKVLTKEIWVPVQIGFYDYGGMCFSYVIAVPTRKLSPKNPLKAMERLLERTDRVGVAAD